MPKYSLAIIDDHPIIVNGIVTCLNKYSNVMDIKCFTSPNVFLQELKDNKFDLILTDISMPNMNGLDLIKNVKRINPNIKIAIFTQHEGEGYFKDAYLLGINAYILKSENPSVVPEIIFRILNGEFYVSQSISHLLKTFGKTKNLDFFEHEIVKLLIEGKSIREISELLGRSSKVIEYRLQKLKLLFSAKNNVELIYKMRIEYFK